jgi:Tol biopolymer transport system component
MRAQWSPPGALLFTRDGDLFAQRMTPDSFQLEGEPAPVIEDVQTNEGNGRSTFAVSRTGLLSYLPAALTEPRQITLRDRSGKILSMVGKPGPFVSPTLSPDGKSIAVISSPHAHSQILTVFDVATGVSTPMSEDGKQYFAINWVWSPDSKQIALRRQGYGLQVTDVTSTRTRHLTALDATVAGWLADGSSVLATMAGGKLLRFPLEGAEPPTVVFTAGPGMQLVRPSPDGNSALYVSTVGTTDVYVASFPSFTVKRRISANGGNYPRWSKGGREIVYVTPDGTVMAVEIRTGSASGFEIGERRALFPFPKGYAHFDVSADGQRFLTAESLAETNSTPEIAVMLNWTSRLKQR